jgi:hypothetical protein
MEEAVVVHIIIHVLLWVVHQCMEVDHLTHTVVDLEVTIEGIEEAIKDIIHLLLEADMEECIITLLRWIKDRICNLTEEDLMIWVGEVMMEAITEVVIINMICIGHQWIEDQ